MSATGQVWVTSSLGGYLSNPKLDKTIRHAAQPLQRFRQFVNVKGASGKKRGDTVQFNKVSNLATSGGTLVETATIPESNVVIRQGSLTITEYGIAVPYTGKLDALAEFDVSNETTVALRNDEAKVLDSAAGAQFKATKSRYACITSTSGTVTTNGTFGATATSQLNAFHVRKIVDQMAKWNVPFFDGENYVCIASIDMLRGIMDDDDWVAAAHYGDPSRIFKGEVGQFESVRFVRENNVLSNAVGSGSAFGEAVFFGADAVMEGVAIPEEIRAKESTDYGRSQGVAWYALLGYQLIWDHETDGETRAVYVGSL